jgi:agmatinase
MVASPAPLRALEAPMTQQSAFEYLRHGQTPFFRLPLVDVAAPAGERYRGADAVLLGVPTDAGTTYQPGARLAPWALRRVSALVQSYHATAGVDVFATLACRDGGNVAFPPFDRAAMREAVAAEVTAIAAAGALPLVVGGDHSVAVPALRALRAAHGPLAIVHVDAHLDTSGPDTWGDAWHHGTPMRHAITEGLVEPGQLYHVGIRGSWGSADDAALTLDAGNHVYFIDEVVGRGITRVAAELRERIGARPAYLSFDVDAIDPAFAPGTGTPVAGGLAAREALALVRGLAGLRLIGADLCEVAPQLDHADMTSHLGAAILFETLAAIAMGRIHG